MKALDEFGRFLSDQISKRGIASVLLAPLVAMGAVLALFGITVSSAAFPVIATLVFLICAVIVLLAVHAHARKTDERLNKATSTFDAQTTDVNAKLRQRSEALTRYAKLVKGMGLDFEIESWREEVRVGAGGRTQVDRDITIRVGATELPLLWSALEKYGDTVPVAARDSIGTEVRLLTHQGGAVAVGPELDHTGYWEHGRQMFVFAHFRDPVKANRQISIRFSWDWPAYSLLAAGRPEDFDCLIHRKCDDYSLLLKIAPEALPQGAKLTAGSVDGDPQPIVTPIAGGGYEIAYSNPSPVVEERFGFRVGFEK